jgi:hypothetical protein
MAPARSLMSVGLFGSYLGYRGRAYVAGSLFTEVPSLRTWFGQCDVDT